MEHILKGLASLASKEPSEYLGTLKSEDGEFLPEDQLVAKLKEDISKHYLSKIEAAKAQNEDQRKRGVRERGEEVESFIKKQYGIDTTGRVEDQIGALVEKIRSEVQPIETPAELTRETALEHPVVKELFDSKLKEALIAKTSQIDKEKEELQKQLEDYIATQEREKIQNAVKLEALTAFKDMRIRLEDDNKQTEPRTKALLRLLMLNDFKLDENGKPYPVNKEGKQLENEMMHDVSFTDLIKSINTYGYHEQDPNKGSASPSTKTGMPAGTKIRFEDSNDFIKRFNAARGEDKKKLKEAWAAQQAEAK